MKFHSVGVELFHVDRWTDMMKLIVTFCNFGKVCRNACGCYEW